MTICNGSRQPKTFAHLAMWRRNIYPESNGLIGDIRKAKKLGFYLTPFGWINVMRTWGHFAGFYAIAMSYDYTIRIARDGATYRVAMPEQRTRIYREGYTKTIYWPTKRGFK